MAYEAVITDQKNSNEPKRHRDHRDHRDPISPSEAKTALKLLRESYAVGLTITLDEDELSLVADTEPPQALIQNLRLHKDAIKKWLSFSKPFGPLTDIEEQPFDSNPHEAFAEPVGIKEECGTKSCASCQHSSRFSNCLIPEQSGLADKYMLISHPKNGADCDAFEPKLNPLAKEALALISIAMREGVISEEDHLQATQSIREHSEDADYLHEWIQLIAACQESKTRRS